MSSDIRSILEKFAALEEGATTPTYVKKGLNKQQKSVPQLPALFKPKSASPALTGKDYPKHPMKGYMVGSNESVEPQNSLEEAMQEVEEDMISKVRADLNSYLDRLSDKMAGDDGYKERKHQHIDQLSDKQQIDHDLMNKAVSAVEKGEVEDEQMSEPVETIAMEDGSLMEIHQDAKGYVIRRLGKELPTKFPALDHARMAVQLFKNRAQHHPEDQDIDQDYIEER